jgi:hypothetical protein
VASQVRLVVPTAILVLLYNCYAVCCIVSACGYRAHCATTIFPFLPSQLYVLGYTGKETMGLVPGHAYTLIAAKQSSSGHRLLKLRNPWGETEWTGAWCDDCPLWADQMQVST